MTSKSDSSMKCNDWMYGSVDSLPVETKYIVAGATK